MPTCCGKYYDPDDIFAYSTQRLVRIRDKRLGCLHLFLLLSAFAYIVGYELVMKQGYKEVGTIVGTTRLQMKQPEAKYRQIPPLYCGNGTYQASGHVYPQLDCSYMDEYDAIFPSLEQTATFITTRYTRLEQRINDPGCLLLPQFECGYYNATDREFFVADPAMFTLRVDHTVTVPEFNMSRSSRNMPGRLVDQAGVTVDPCEVYLGRGFPKCPSYVHIGEQIATASDTFPVESLLQAAGISNLNEPSGVPHGSSRRYDGVVLVVLIEYDNYYTYHPSDVRYTYSVSAVKNTEFKTNQVIPDRGVLLSNRTILDRHGVRILFVQSGTIGEFNAATTLVALVSSLGLLAAATLAVDVCMQYVLPLKHVYRQYKTVRSLEVAEYTEDELHKVVVNPEPRIPDHLRSPADDDETKDADAKEEEDLYHLRGGNDHVGCWDELIQYFMWLTMWRKRIYRAYLPYVPGVWAFMVQEHPVAGLCDRKAKHFRLGPLGRVVVLIVMAAYAVCMSAVCDHLAKADVTGYYAGFYLLVVPSMLFGFTFWSAIVKGLTRSRSKCAFTLLIVTFVVVTGLEVLGVAVLLFIRPHHTYPSTLDVILNGLVGLVAAVILEIPKHLLARSCKATGVSWWFICRACCRTRSCAPWTHEVKFREFFESMTLVDDEDDSSYVQLSDSPGSGISGLTGPSSRTSRDRDSLHRSLSGRLGAVGEDSIDGAGDAKAGAGGGGDAGRTRRRSRRTSSDSDVGAGAGPSGRP